MLCSYVLKFNFRTDSGFLNYLSGKSFVLPKYIDLLLQKKF